MILGFLTNCRAILPSDDLEKTQQWIQGMSSHLTVAENIEIEVLTADYRLL